MKALVFTISLTILASIGFAAQKECKITYIANEGFLIEVEGKKIIIDGLFDKIDGDWCDSPSNDMLELMSKALPPFNNIDLIAITHQHRDHFNKEVVASYLNSNKKAIVICPMQVKDQLSSCVSYKQFSDRIISITPKKLQSENLKIAEISFKVMRLEHSHYMEDDPENGGKRNRHRNIENLGFLFDLNGYKIFHCGDTNPLNEEEYQTFALYEENINLAFLDRMFISKGKLAMDILNNYIAPRDIVIMHINPTNIQAFKSHFATQDNIKIFENKMETVTYSF